MKVAADLHIHTSLSPCADEDMTPNNIVNMATLKGLDVIAVTDHNSALNVSSVIKCAKSKNILVIPGIEVETVEEVHIVCLFMDLNDLLNVHDVIQSKILKIPLNESIFGKQSVTDEFDNITQSVNYLLSTATQLSLDDLYELVKENNGVFIPAHIDRPANGIISVLGYIPDNLNIETVEVSKNCDALRYQEENISLKSYNLYSSSDAHFLGDILERELFIEAGSFTIPDVLDALKHNTCLVRNRRFL